MRYALLTLLAATSSVALAQSRPQLTWQGYVSGSAVLHIQGDRVDVQGRDTGSVDRPNVNMYEPLPAARQTIQMDVRRGRGRVQVVEHPTPRNEYTATVRIDPVGNRHELFAIDFFWDAYGDRRNTRRNRRDDDYYGYGTGTRSRTDDRYVEPGQMTWSGTVDHEALVEVRGQRVNVRTLRGQRVYGSNPSFSSALPRQNVNVRLDAAQGRGRVELVEQPNPNNNYTAVVRIFDEDNGAAQYAFRLVWDDAYGSSNSGTYGTYRNEPYAANSGGILTPQGGSYDPYYGSATGTGGMRWTGRVDGTVRVSVRGNRAWSTRVSGQPISGEQVSFGSSLPARNVGDVDVRKVQGRGDVRVLQHPSANNGYTLVFEVEDEDGGADDYGIEVLWR